jgi:hypothetical protein
MTMGFKYQMMLATQASDIFQISLNHLDVLAAIVAGSEVQGLIDRTRTLLVEVCIFVC